MLHTSFYASKTVRENSKEKLKLGYRVIKMFECYYFFFLNVELNSFPLHLTFISQLIIIIVER